MREISLARKDFEREEVGSDKPEIGTENESEALAAARCSSSCIDMGI